MVQPSSAQINFPVTPHLPRVSRELEKSLGISLRTILSSELAELEASLAALSRTVRKSIPVLPDKNQNLLVSALNSQQLREIDQQLLPLYAELLEMSEEPREHMKIAECGEPLVNLTELLSRANVKFSLTESTFHEACGSWAGKPKIFWLRQEVALKVLELGKLLNSIDILIRLEDGYRPFEVQQGLYRRRLISVRTQYPHFSEDEVIKETRAKTASAPYRAAHMSGAALDLTLCTPENVPLPLGNTYPSGGAAAMLFFPYLTWEEFRTRQIFLNAALLVGLFPYLGEDWHVSLGDGLANLWTGATHIRYAPLRSLDLSTGTPVPLSAELLRKEFSADLRSLEYL